MTETTSANPRVAPGDNKPPLDPPEELKKRLDADYAELLNEATDLELASFKLPESPTTDEECGLITDFIVSAKALAKRMEESRVGEKDPYFQAGKIVDGFFSELKSPVETKITSLNGRVNAYQRAKAEREAAERREAERIAREEAERKRREEEEARRAAEEAERRAQEEAARIRSAADAEERAAAETRMREEAQRAEEQRAAADEAARKRAEEERRAEAQARAASGGTKLSKVSTGGSSASVTTFWNHRIKDADKLVASLGPLGPYLSNDAIMSAINAAKREYSRLEKMPELDVPGVEFFEDQRTNVRATRS